MRRKSLPTLLNIWRDTPTIASNIAAWRIFDAYPAQTAPFPADLHPTLAQALGTQGIDALYTHQATTWEYVHAGRHPVIVTGTASGKTLCYNLPILHTLLANPQTRALYLFPTKALAYDQVNQLTIINEQLSNLPPHTSHPLSPIPISTYDGDTPASARPAIRTQARLILSNPDMLHTAILPHHTKWADFFKHLRFVVIDEMHVYRGVFGSHVANALRRLKRIARFYQEHTSKKTDKQSSLSNYQSPITNYQSSNLQFILTSATIANPTELAERLIEEPVTLVNNDGAARGPKHFLLYNPPIINPELGLRRSALQESIRLSQELLHHNVQTIIFARARRTVEIILNYLREQAAAPPSETNDKVENQNKRFVHKLSTPDSHNQPPNADSSDSNNNLSSAPLLPRSPAPPPPRSPTPPPPHSPAPSIRAYRSGYLPRHRREIEQGLREGHVRTVVATSALELGIDIGGMGAAVLAGYPGSIAGTWQQAGRAGRQSEASLAILIASANPLDQFLAHHPDYFFDRSPEQALINPDNLLILLQHLRCAAFELPFQNGDNFGRVEAEQTAEFLQFLRDSGELHQSGSKYFWMADRYPATDVSLRSASPDRVRLQIDEGDDNWSAIGEVDVASAPWMVHPQAVYLHQGQAFIVETLDLDQLVACLRPTGADYYTEPKRDTSVQLVEQISQTQVYGGTKSHGEMVVTTQVVGYRMVQSGLFHSNKLTN